MARISKILLSLLVGFSPVLKASDGDGSAIDYTALLGNMLSYTNSDGSGDGGSTNGVGGSSSSGNYNGTTQLQPITINFDNPNSSGTIRRQVHRRRQAPPVVFDTTISYSGGGSVGGSTSPTYVSSVSSASTLNPSQRSADKLCQQLGSSVCIRQKVLGLTIDSLDPVRQASKRYSAIQPDTTPVALGDANPGEVSNPINCSGYYTPYESGSVVTGQMQFCCNGSDWVMRTSSCKVNPPCGAKSLPPTGQSFDSSNHMPIFNDLTAVSAFNYQAPGTYGQTVSYSCNQYYKSNQGGIVNGSLTLTCDNGDWQVTGGCSEQLLCPAQTVAASGVGLMNYTTYYYFQYYDGTPGVYLGTDPNMSTMWVGLLNSYGPNYAAYGYLFGDPIATYLNHVASGYLGANTVGSLTPATQISAISLGQGTPGQTASVPCSGYFNLPGYDASGSLTYTCQGTWQYQGNSCSFTPTPPPAYDPYSDPNAGVGGGGGGT